MMWQRRALRHIARVMVSNVDKHFIAGQPVVRLCNYTDVYKNEVLHDSLPYMTATAAQHQVEQYRLFPGDTIITKDSETSDDIGIPAFVESASHDLVCGYHLAIVRPNRDLVYPKYLTWAMRSRAVTAQWEVLATGVTRVGLKLADIRSVRIHLPRDIREQREIVAFLDRETSSIDLLIEKQQSLIERLRERRSAIISQWVCAGLDPAVRTKPTGLHWLPDVPEHWSVLPVSALFRVRNEPSRPSDEHLTPSQRYGVIPQREYMQLTGARVVLNLTGADSMKHVESGDVISHLRSFQGGLETSDTSGKVSQAYTVMRPLRPIVRDYYRYLFKSSRYIQALQVTTNQLRDGQAIRFPELRQIPLPFPPLDEQQEIAARLHQETARIDALIEKAQRFILLARERRAALITATVSGHRNANGRVA